MQFIGLMGLISELGLTAPFPAVRSQAGPSSRKTEEKARSVVETYPARYACGTLRDHLRFALSHEPIDLNIWREVVLALPADVIVEWVREQPSSSYARRAWYLYERLSGKQLPLADTQSGVYVELANPELQLTWLKRDREAPHARRYRVRNNLLGTTGKHGYCPMVRLSGKLKELQRYDYAQQVREITAGLDPTLLHRAAGYLYANETRSSYALEGERPSPDREQRFVEVLARAGDAAVVSRDGLVALQRSIVQDERFSANGWRTMQNYVGHLRLDMSEEVAYPCPRPEDVDALMTSWMEMLAKMLRADRTDAVILAACASFGFVYIHPFEDGNGRIHRFLIHHVLSRLGYTATDVVFPVSAAIVRRRREYEQVLDRISSEVRARTQSRFDDDGTLHVEGNTIDLYRYPDLTAHAEFLYECIAETVEKDWPDELRFLKTFDSAFRAVQSIVDMPDNRIRLLIRLLMQNEGRLAANKREQFALLTDSEIAEIETKLAPILAPPPEDGAA